MEQHNLFRQHISVRDEQFFFGRSDLMTRIGSALSRGDAVQLTGLRKSGKTSVLNLLRHHLLEHPWCRFDFEGYDSTSDWPAKLFQALVGAYDRWGHRTFNDWPDEPSSPGDKAELVDAMARRREWQRERGSSVRPILVIDEAEHIFPHEEEVEAARRWRLAAGTLRDLAQSRGERWLSILAADHRPVINRVNLLADGRQNPFFRFFREEPVGLFAPDEVGEMLSSIGQAMGIADVSPALVAQLHAYANGHPGFSRLIAASVYEHRAENRAMTAEDLRVALKKMHRSGKLGHYIEQGFWLSMTTLEQEIVVWLLEHPEAELPEDLSDEVEVLGDLVGQGILHDDGERYTIAMEGLKIWLARYLRRKQRVSA